MHGNRRSSLDLLAAVALITLCGALAFAGCDSGGGGGSGTDTDTDSDSDSDTDADSDADTDTDTDVDTDTDTDIDTDTDTDSDGDTDLMEPTDFCNADGWCWENPTPHGNTLRAVWMNGPDDVWYAGDGGRISRYSGDTWYAWSSGSNFDSFRALWGTGPTNMFALSPSTLWRYDGSWSAILTGSGMNDVQGFGTDDIWVCGYGEVRHWTGASWESFDFGTANLTALFGVASDDVWVAGYDGAIFRWNGSGWTDHTQATTDDYYDVWGAATDDVYFVSGGTPLVSHWDGAAVEQIDPGFVSGWTSVSGTAADDVWVMGGSGIVAHYDGGFWGEESLDVTTWGVTDLQVTADAGPWVVGVYGLMCEREGSAWACSDSLTFETVLDLWGAAGDAMTAMGTYGPIASRDAGGWSLESPPTTLYMEGVWQIGEDDAWGYRNDWSDDRLHLYHWDGAAWNDTPVDAPRGMNDVWVDADGAAWAVGDAGLACRYDGSSWTCSTAGTTNDLFAVWGISADDVWAVGESGTAVHWDGAAWTAGSTGSSDELVAVWGADANDVWAAGDWGAEAYHYTGTWAASSIPGTSQVLDLYGFATDDVWAVGYSGSAAHWDGSSWTDVDTGVWDQLYSVWGAASDDVWAVGEHGAVIHWNGSAWAADASIDEWYTMAVGGTAADDAWIVASYSGAMYHNAGSGWVPVTNPLTEAGVYMSDVFGTASGELWVLEMEGRLHSREGDLWSRHGFLDEQDAVVTDVAAVAADDVWATVEEGLLLHYDGVSWKLHASHGASRLDAVHAPGASQAWAVGDVLLSWDGAEWSLLTEIATDSDWAEFVGIYGVSDSQVRLLHNDGTLYEWDGSGLDAVFTVPYYSTYMDAHFVGLDDLWAVGAAGALLRWDGVAVDQPESLTTNTLTSVFAAPDGHVFAGGYAGTILRLAPE